MDVQSRHLSDGQIEDCALTYPGSGPNDLEAHLSQCQDCLRRLLQWQLSQIKGLRVDTVKSERYPDCPADAVLKNVAAQLASPQTAAEALQHASRCDHCGPQLREYLEVFSDDLSPEIQALIELLPLSQPDWPKQKAHELVSRFRPRRPGFWERLRALWATARLRTVAATATVLLLASIGILGGPAIVFQVNMFLLGKKIAAAGADNRTFEPRLTEISYGPYHKTSTEDQMGNEQSTDLARPAMSDAESKLSSLLAGGSKDPRLWQDKGRLLLLKNPKNTQAAEVAFEEARAKGLHSLNLEIDLAVTYFQRDIRSDKPNLSKTIDILERVLHSTKPEPSKEERAVALFNLALAYEKSNQWDMAEETWNEYLKIDPSGPWAGEAQKHRQDARTKRSKQQGYHDPDDFVRHSTDPEVSRDVEQYLEMVMVRCLVQAISEPSSTCAHAAQRVAELMAEKHDPFLRDFLQSTQQEDLPAVRAVSAAFVDNQNDLHGRALDESRSAARDFVRRGNRPGSMLARFQEVYALQRSLLGQDCLSAVDRVWPSVSKPQYRYRWLKGQLALERAICANMVAKFLIADESLKLSRESAGEDLPELGLRITGIEAGMKRLNHDYDGAWREVIDGLPEFWEHSYSPERLYQFYTVMRSVAADTGSFHTAEALLRRSIEILKDIAPEDKVLVVLLQLRLANLLFEERQDALAKDEADRAIALIKQLPEEDNTAKTYLILAKIELAEFVLRTRQPQLALESIQPIADRLDAQDNFVKLDFYRVRGDARLQLQQYDHAAADYQHAIRLAEDAFGNIGENEERRLHWLSATNSIYRGVVQVLLARQQTEKALFVWEWSQKEVLHRDTRTGRLPDFMSEPAPMRLPPVTDSHVVFASFPDRLQIWTIQGSKVQGRSVALGRAELERQVRDFERLCENPESPEIEVRKRGAALYELLLQPVVATLELANTVVVEFDRALPGFAIEALLGPDGKFLGAKFALVRSPGLFGENTLRKPATFTRKEPFLLVDASALEGPDFLPGHQMQTRAAVDLYPNSKVLTIHDSTVERVAQELPHSAGIHFFGHGRLGGRGMALELAPDRYLRAEDLTPDLLGDARLAVLAACSSGNSKTGLLDSTSLVRALLKGHVSSVITSHWDVDSVATAELVSSFYAFLGKGETPAQALRDARKEVLSKPSYSHPYYWAAFDLTGRSS